MLLQNVLLIIICLLILPSETRPEHLSPVSPSGPENV